MAMKCSRQDCLDDARWAPLLHVPLDDRDVEPLTALVRLPLCETHFGGVQAAVLLDEGPRSELQRQAAGRGLVADFDRTWITPVAVDSPDFAAARAPTPSGHMTRRR